MGGWPLALPSPLHDLIVSSIRNHGPLTVADYMELALYHPQFGYYTSAPRRSGRAGDFHTSVDVGPLFGEIVAAQLGELWQLLRDSGAPEFHLVECGAGDGRLARDVLDAAARTNRDFYEALHVSLCDRSPAAAEAQRATLASHAGRVTVGCPDIPGDITGAIVANELLDALPVHRVAIKDGLLHELHIAEREGTLHEVPLPPSSGRIGSWLSMLNVPLPEHVIAEVGLAGDEWIANAAAALQRGVLMLFDYGAAAEQLFSPLHGSGTLMSFRKHIPDADHWLQSPGECDITSHVNFTAVSAGAERGGLVKLGQVDQTYFAINLGVTAMLNDEPTVPALRRRLAARTLLIPGGMGSAIKAIAFGKNLGTPRLRGFSAGRVS